MIKLIVYIINFTLLNQWQLPTFLRKNKQTAWVDVFTLPYKNYHEAKQAWRGEIRYKLHHNGQVIYLEKVLNEYYNINGYDHQDHQGTKQIYIGNGERVFPTYIYTTPEQQPVDLYTTAENYPLHIYTDAEINDGYADFIVWVPVALTYIEAEMRALINYYIDTKIYKIKTY